MLDKQHKHSTEAEPSTNRPASSPAFSAIKAIVSFLRKTLVVPALLLPFSGDGTHHTVPVRKAVADVLREDPNRRASLSEKEREILRTVQIDTPIPGDLTMEQTNRTVTMRFDGKVHLGILNEEGAMTSLTIGGKTISYTVPVSKNDMRLVAWNAVRTCARIDGRGDLRLPPTTKFRGIGGRRIECKVEKDGKPMTYVATPDDVLLLTGEEPMTAEERLRLKEIETSIQEILREELHARERHPEGLNWDVFLSDIPEAERGRKRQKIVTAIQRIRVLERDAAPLRLKEKARVLVSTQGEKVYESNDAEHPNSYDRFVPTQGGNPERQERYLNNRLWRKSTKTPDREVSLYVDESNGKSHVTVYDGGHNSPYGESRAPDGTLLSISRGKNTDSYDTKGALSYRTTLSSDGKQRIQLFDERENVFFDPLALQTEKLREKIDTPEKFHIWENKYWDDRSMTDEQKRQMREFGKSVCGIEDLRTKMQKAHGGDLCVELDTVPQGTSFVVCDMRTLRKGMPIVEKALQTYSPGFLDRIKLVKITLVDGSDVRDGGFFSVQGFNDRGSVTLTLSAPEQTTRLTHHEIFHQVEHALETINPKDRFWWLPKEQKGKGVDLGNDDFAIEYGQTNAMEDKATIAQELMESRQARILRGRAKNNPLLSEKIRQIEDLYYIASEGKMDRKFWEDVESGVTINGSYWEKRQQKKDFVANPGAEGRMRSFSIKKSVSKDADRINDSMHGKARQEALAKLYVDAIRKDPQSHYFGKLDNMFYDSVLGKIRMLEHIAEAAAIDPKKTPIFTYDLLFQEYMRRGRKHDARKLLDAMRDHSWHRDYAIELMKKLDEK